MDVEIPLSGHCDARFAAVRDEFDRNFRERGEIGAAVCVIAGGAPVVDLAGGWADSARRKPWRHDTLVDYYSVGKAFVALLALQLVDEGRIALDDPIGTVWPEFAGGGKEATTLRHALCHRAGVPAIRAPLTDDDLWDWGRMTAALAATDPWWEPGTRHGYHTNTYGHLVGEVVRRVSGQRCRERLAALAGPLGADVHVGVPVGARGRCAEVVFRAPQRPNDRRPRGADGRRPDGDAQLLQPAGVLVHRRGQLGALARRRGAVDQRTRHCARGGAALRRAAPKGEAAVRRPAGRSHFAAILRLSAPSCTRT